MGINISSLSGGRMVRAPGRGTHASVVRGSAKPARDNVITCQRL